MPLAQTDVQDLFALRSDREVMQYWDWPGDSSPEATSRVLATFLAEVSSEDALHWSIRTRSQARFVGCCDLSDLRSSEGPEVGFMLARGVWGHGYGHELLQALIAKAMEMRLATLQARIHTGNVRSKRLLVRCGFTKVRADAGHEIRPGVRCACTWFRRAL